MLIMSKANNCDRLGTGWHKYEYKFWENSLKMTHNKIAALIGMVPHPNFICVGVFSMTIKLSCNYRWEWVNIDRVFPRSGQSWLSWNGQFETIRWVHIILCGSHFCTAQTNGFLSLLELNNFVSNRKSLGSFLRVKLALFQPSKA